VSTPKHKPVPRPGEVKDAAALAALVPSDAPEPEPEPEPEQAESPEETPIPSGAEEAPQEPETDDSEAQPLPREYVILTSNASYGPVIIAGRRTHTVKNRLYYVPDAEERADILGTGRFRVATAGDLGRAGSPSAGPGGAITRDLLPPGAIKGGLNQ
jgi:hypothetical protein